MRNERLDWGELVDLYVDNECDDESRSLVEKKAATDAEIRASVDSALRIRNALRELRAAPPKELNERIISAVRDASVSTISAEPSRGLGSGKALRIRFVLGALATVAASVAVVVAVRATRCEVVVPRGVHNVENVVADKPAIIGETARDDAFIRTPSPAGGLPNSVAKRDSQNAFWTKVTLGGDAKESRKEIREIQSKFVELGVRFSKIGANEFRLENIDARRYKSFLDELEQSNALESSSALKEWLDESGDETQSVRVVFISSETRPEQVVEE